jgi:DNA-binding CsgD family transcriptional regulator
MTSEDILNIAGLFYDGVLSDEGWQDALKALSVATHSSAASLVLWNRRDDAAVVGEQTGLPYELSVEYAQHYHLLDPGRHIMDRVALGDWYLDERDLGLPAMERSSFYVDFLKKYSLDSTMACPIVRGFGTTDGFLSLSAPLGRRDQAAVAESMKVLVPHIQRAVKLRTHLIELSQQSSRLKGTIDRVALPLLVLSAEGRVLLANASGTKWTSEIETILATDSNKSRALSTALRNACQLHAPRAATIKMEGNDGEPYFLNVVPINEALSVIWGASAGTALVSFNVPSRQLSSPDELLNQLFGLTKAEIRLVNRLREGETLQEASFTLEVSVGTARTQLKSIFRKLGVRRQAELQRLLGRLEMVDLT